jgi:DNA-binding response OmpR family regulator
VFRNTTRIAGRRRKLPDFGPIGAVSANIASLAAITPHGFFSLFALISPTSRDAKNAQWYLHKNKTCQKLEGTKGMVNSNRERKRILLVEDQEDAWEIAAYNLGEYALFYAHDFDEGLLAARRSYFDLYILDSWLPDGSGVGLCRAIREFDPHTPILFYTAAAYERDIEDALRAGAQDYLIKPVIPDELKQAVARLISVAPETAFEARRVEIAAIREELAIRRTENIELIERAKKKYLYARVKAIRLRAEMAFLAAGGTRGAFAREWLPVFLEELCGAAVSG